MHRAWPHAPHPTHAAEVGRVEDRKRPMTYTVLPLPSRHAHGATVALLGLALLSLGGPAASQGLGITPLQNATAREVAQSSVALADLAPGAPDQHTVRRGDTLWSLATLFLRSPWRWPELWGMNLQAIDNPHRIYPGQQLVLERSNGRARLRLAGQGDARADAPPADVAMVRLSPQVRSTALPEALSTLPASAIEPFLAQPLIVQEGELQAAARIVATQEHRVMLSQGDRAYARGPAQTPLREGVGPATWLNVFRETSALKDPDTGELLGYEARRVGQARLVRGEGESTQRLDEGARSVVVPATLDIVSAVEEIRVGDRLLPPPERGFQNYIPHAPGRAVEGRIIAVHGSAVVHAAQNQVVVINRGRREGIEHGHVLALLSDGGLRVDPTDAQRSPMRLPDERNGLLLVFQVYDKLAYGLVLNTRDGVRVGDRLAAPL